MRGSTGYGHHFVEMNRADWGGGDFKDVMAGADWLVARGIADPNRLGIGGWSYGGYMAAWAVTQTTRFKAAVSGAPVIDMASEFGTENGSAYDEWFYGTPYEKLDGFIKSSPMTFVKNVKTPTLLLQGEDDTTDPIGQSQQFYRGLKRYGVESDLVLYPREPHGLREEHHLVDRLTRILAWYDRYLKPAALVGHAAAVERLQSGVVRTFRSAVPGRPEGLHYMSDLRQTRRDRPRSRDPATAACSDRSGRRPEETAARAPPRPGRSCRRPASPHPPRSTRSRA